MWYAYPMYRRYVRMHTYVCMYPPGVGDQSNRGAGEFFFSKRRPVPQKKFVTLASGGECWLLQPTINDLVPKMFWENAAGALIFVQTLTGPRCLVLPCSLRKAGSGARPHPTHESQKKLHSV